MILPIYQVDAFTRTLFSGNPAAICPVESWPDAALMQSIAAENNLAETAFLVREGEEYGLRWFTPVCEVDLCGHATLASAYVVFRFLDSEAQAVRFRTRSGVLTVTRDGDALTMDFPTLLAQSGGDVEALADALGRRPVATLQGRSLMAVFEHEDDVRALRPDMAKVERLECHAVIATAPGQDCDFVSRFFAPAAGIPEDPVTGSAHCTLAPYWAERLGKTRLHARQVSARGGEILCELRGDRVLLTGHAVLYLEGQISVEG